MSDEKTQNTARKYFEDMLDYAAEVGFDKIEIRITADIIGVDSKPGEHYLMGVEVVESTQDGSTQLPRYYITSLLPGSDEYEVVAYGCDYGELYENTRAAIENQKQMSPSR